MNSTHDPFPDVSEATWGAEQGTPPPAGQDILVKAEQGARNISPHLLPSSNEEPPQVSLDVQ